MRFRYVKADPDAKAPSALRGDDKRNAAQVGRVRRLTATAAWETDRRPRHARAADAGQSCAGCTATSGNIARNSPSDSDCLCRSASDGIVYPPGRWAFKRVNEPVIPAPWAKKPTVRERTSPYLSRLRSGPARFDGCPAPGGHLPGRQGAYGSARETVVGGPRRRLHHES